MEENKNEELDAFFKRLVKDAGLEEPSADFTNAVLSKIGSEPKTTSVFDYQPLISKKIWLFLATLFIGLFAYVIFGNPNMETSLPYLFKLERLTAFNLLGSLPRIAISGTLVYGLVVLAFFVVVQVVLLDRKFGKNLGLG